MCEAEIGAPVMQVALQRDDLARELMPLEVVLRLPGRRPLLRQLEVHRAAEGRLRWDEHVGSARGRRRNRLVARRRTQAEVIGERVLQAELLAAHARVPHRDAIAAWGPRARRAKV